MAFSFFSFVLVFLFIINLSYAQSDLVTKVCSKTQDQPLCFETLKSAGQADLKGIGQISIDASKKDGQNTLNYVESLSKQASDPTLKNRYDTCVEVYDTAVAKLDESKQALGSGDIQSFYIFASAAFEGPVTCEDSFEGPPSAPAKLQEANKKSKGLIGIVLSVGVLLQGQ